MNVTGKESRISDCLYLPKNFGQSQEGGRVGVSYLFSDILRPDSRSPLVISTGDRSRRIPGTLRRSSEAFDLTLRSTMRMRLMVLMTLTLILSRTADGCITPTSIRGTVESRIVP